MSKKGYKEVKGLMKDKLPYKIVKLLKKEGPMDTRQIMESIYGKDRTPRQSRNVSDKCNQLRRSGRIEVVGQKLISSSFTQANWVKVWRLVE